MNAVPFELLRKDHVALQDGSTRFSQSENVNDILSRREYGIVYGAVRRRISRGSNVVCDYKVALYRQSCFP